MSKKFLIIGNMNAITYKEVFPLIKDNKLWTGYGFNLSMVYKTTYKNELESNRKYVISKGYNPDDGFVKVPAVTWFTNMVVNKENKLILTESYYDEHGKPRTDKFPTYDNYNAINVDKVVEIPKDYYGVMGVPITFIDKYNPEQFDIISHCEPAIEIEKFKKTKYFKEYKSRQITIDGVICQKTYHRILIKRKEPEFEIVGLAAGNSKATGLYYNVKYTPNSNDRGGCGVINNKRLYSRLLIKRK